MTRYLVLVTFFSDLSARLRNWANIGVGTLAVTGLACTNNLANTADPSTSSVAHLEKACAAGEAASCNQSAFAYATGLDIPRNPQRQRALNQASCALHDQLGCTNFATNLIQGVGGEKDVPRGITLLQNACPDGLGIGCTALAVQTLRTSTNITNQDNAINLLKANCDKNYLSACAHYAATFFDASLRERPHVASGEVSAELAQRTCNEGQPLGCQLQGRHLARGTLARPDQAQARKLWQETCELGSSESCLLWIESQLNTRSTPPPIMANFRKRLENICDESPTAACVLLAEVLLFDFSNRSSTARARTILQEACDVDPCQCTLLARAYHADKHAPEIPHDIEKAKSLFAKACDAQCGGGCFGLVQTMYGEDATSQTVISKKLSLLKQGCEFRDPDSCGSLATRYWLGKDVAKDLELADYYANVGCLLQDPESCAIKANLLDKDNASASDRTEAFTAAQRACWFGAGSSCTRLSLMLERDISPRQPIPEAIAALEFGCGHDSATSCYFLANHYRNGLHVEPDSALAIEYYRLGCWGGVRYACNSIREFGPDGRISPKEADAALVQELALIEEECNKNHDPYACRESYLNMVLYKAPDEKMQGLTLLSQACAKKDAAACFRRGYAHTKKIDGVHDYREAARYYQKACDLDASWCTNLGLLYYYGRGVKQNLKRAKSFAEKACAADDFAACDNLATMLYHGQAGAADMQRAASLFEKECNRAGTGACFKLGVMRERGEGGAQNLEEAISLYTWACAGEREPRACNNLAVMYGEGRGTQADPEKSKALAQAACKQGYTAACQELVSITDLHDDD